MSGPPLSLYAGTIGANWLKGGTRPAARGAFEIHGWRGACPPVYIFRMGMTAMQQLGMRVRAARDATGLSQAAFAEKAGMDRLYFGRIELGKQNPTAVVLLRIALEAGVDAASFFEGIVVDADELRSLPRPTRGPRKDDTH